MKYLIVFAALFAACYAEMGGMMTDPQKKEWAEQCAKETGADLAEFGKGKEHMKELMQKKEYKCFFKCFGMKAGYLNDKGELNMEKMELVKDKFKMADPSKLTEAVTKCSAENKQEDLCEKVAATSKCIWTALKPQ